MRGLYGTDGFKAVRTRLKYFSLFSVEMTSVLCSDQFGSVPLLRDWGASRPLASMRAAATALPNTTAVPRLASTLVGSPNACTHGEGAARGVQLNVDGLNGDCIRLHFGGGWLLYSIMLLKLARRPTAIHCGAGTSSKQAQLLLLYYCPPATATATTTTTTTTYYTHCNYRHA